MAIQNKDYFTFLGGEVSPNLFKRVDMRAANKWFETAKNIFFDTTGGFFNRVGTEVVDNTYIAGYKIKLLKFVFNKEQSYEVIFSQTNIKIYDNKTLLQTITHNTQIPVNFDIIYTQIGDVMYICLGGTTKIYTLKRYANDNWVFEEFKYNIPPMLENNQNTSNTLSFSKNSSYEQLNYCEFSISELSVLNDIVVSYKDSNNTYHNLFTGTSPYTLEGFVLAFNSSISTNLGFEASKIGYSKIKIEIPQAYSSDVLSIKIQTNGIYVVKQITNTVPSTLLNDGWSGNYIEEDQRYTIKNETMISSAKFVRPNSNNNFNISYNKSYPTPIGMQNFLQEVQSEYGGPFYIGSTYYSNAIGYNSSMQIFEILCAKYRNYSGGLFLTELVYHEKNDNVVLESDVVSGVNSNQNIYNVSASFNFFENKFEDYVFSIDSLFSPSFDGTAGENKTVSVTGLTTGTGYLPSSEGFWSNGNWRLVTSGLMDGTLELEYSYDGINWYSHRSFTSGIKTVSGVSSSTLYNEYGTLDVDDNVKLRLKYDLVGSTNLGITFDTDSFENRGYYKILKKNSATSAIVECIKYPIGTPSQTHEWAEAAWSDTEGYPTICFTYQNRLCFAKTTGNPFTVWTSRTNDYSDFSTKVKYLDDDPISMDVVKFNGVSNISTVAALNKLFIFTEDAEYGIQDQGALTQANKSLVAFSKYGAEPIETQVSGNRIVFVENGGKAARQLFYDFAQENYEAPDLTVLYKHLLKNEKIIATDYIGLDYRTYLMLTSSGRVICYKHVPEQEVTACSWFKHAKGTITNISVLDVGNNVIRLYMAVDVGSKKNIEVMDFTIHQYLDSRHTFTTVSDTDTIDVTGFYDNGDVVTYLLNGVKYTATIASNTLTLEEEVPSDTSITVGYSYEAEATLIPVSVLSRNGSANYNKKNIFKANFEYFDSVGFKVGVKDYQDEFEEIQYLEGNIGDEYTPHSGEKDDIIIESSYLGKNMLSFKQSEPYKMNITNLQIEVDYGG